MLWIFLGVLIFGLYTDSIVASIIGGVGILVILNMLAAVWFRYLDKALGK